MVKFNYENEEISIPNNWNEMNLGTYIRFSTYKQSADYDPDYEGIMLLDILAQKPNGYFDDLPLGELTKIFKDNKFNFDEKKLNILTGYRSIITVNGETYSYPKTMNDVTTSEYITIKNLCKNLNEPNDLLKVVPILLRKCVEVTDDLGNKKIKREKLDTSKIDENYNLFKEHVYITDVIASLKVFTNGKKI